MSMNVDNMIDKRKSFGPVPNYPNVEEYGKRMDDIWPIENVWWLIREKLRRQKRQPKTVTGLKRRINVIWKELDQELCQKMMESIPKRLKALIVKKGYRIRHDDYKYK